MNLRAKLVKTMVAALALIACAVLAVVTSLHVWTAQATERLVEGKIEDGIVKKGVGLVNDQVSALRPLVSDNAFGDVRRMVKETVRDDSDLVYGLFLGADRRPWVYVSPSSRDGAMPEAWRELNIDGAPAATATVRSERRRAFGQDVVQFAGSVFDENHVAVGTLVYGISAVPLAAALEAARTEARRSLVITVLLIVMLTVATMAVGLLLVRRTAAHITRPLSELTAAAATISAGQHSVRVSIKSQDELETLGEAFNQMVGELEESYRRLATLNHTLENRVEERTQALAARNRDMRLVLDTVEEGLLTVSRDGWLSEERSARIEAWFGTYDGRTRFVDYMARVDADFAESFALALDALADDFLPMAVILAQIPSRLQAGGRQFQFSYLPIAPGSIEQGLLIVVNDVTDRLALMQHEAEQKEVLAALQGITQDRVGFLAFFDEATQMMDELSRPGADVAGTKRLVHTLKGNASGFGFTLVDELCHRLEDQLAESALAPADAQAASRTALSQLQDRWATLSRTVNDLVGDRGRRMIELGADELLRLRDAVEKGLSPELTREVLARWQLEPVERPLLRLGERARRLSAELGRGGVAVTVDGGGVRLDARRWTRLWSELTHVVRNSVDHGFLPEAERLAAGHPAPALRLSAQVSDLGFTVEIADNGVGIDWQQVRAAAQRRGLPCAADADLTAALLAPGFTTRDGVSSTAGRGVGMTAVGQLVREWNGSVFVVSQPGAGTTWRLVFPRARLGPGEGVDRSLVAAA